MDGSLQLYDIATEQVTFSARHSESPVWYLDYSISGDYLVIHRSYETEVRLARDGSLLGRYAATASALSGRGLAGLRHRRWHAGAARFGQHAGVWRIPCYSALIYSVSFSPDGRQVISSGQDAPSTCGTPTAAPSCTPSSRPRWTPPARAGPSRAFPVQPELRPRTSAGDRLRQLGHGGQLGHELRATQFVITSVPSYTRDGMITIHPQFPEWFRVDLAQRSLLHQ